MSAGLPLNGDEVHVIDVVCATCHRHERWDAQSRAVVEVVVPGGRRRADGAPQWARGRTALRAFAGETGPVVDVCSECGQLLVAATPGLAGIEVRVDTPLGALRVHEQITGPGGPMSREEAEAWLEAQYKVPRMRGVWGDLGRLLFFVTVVPPFLLWLGSMLFIAVFLAAIYEGAPDAVRGTVGFDMARQPQVPGGADDEKAEEERREEPSAPAGEPPP